MNEINLQLVREFFELNLFRVLTHWQQEQAASLEGPRGSQLFVENVQPLEERDLDVILRVPDLRHMHRAVAEVRAWHGDRFYASYLREHPVLTHFAGPSGMAPLRVFFGEADFKTILVVSELPASPELRAQAADSVRDAGIDHLLEFPTILRDMLDKVSINGAFTASHTLQLIQLLKRYRLIRNQQMEFNFPIEGLQPPRDPEVDTQVVEDDDEGES